MELFKFKRFSVKNQDSAMRVGTDGVLIGAWADVNSKTLKVLDIGTGTGVISLILAQRLFENELPFNIVGIDIDISSATEASYNFGHSPWQESLKAFPIALNDFISDTDKYGDEMYDLIVSNPPYFINSLKAPDMRRSSARHTDSLSFYDIVKAARNRLSTEGRLAVILPYNEFEVFDNIAIENGLYLRRRCNISTTPRKFPKRVMAEFARIAGEIQEDSLIIQNGGDFTDEYKLLTKDFYLKF